MNKRIERLKKELTLAFLGLAIVIVLAVYLLLSALLSRSLAGIIPGIIGVVLLLIVAKILKSCIRRIPFPETWIIDRAGELIPKKAGYRFIIPFFGYEKIYSKVKTNIQYYIPLFPDVEMALIDLRTGGEIHLHDPRVWIVVENPLTTVQKTVNFEEQIREICEHRLTGGLNALTHEDVIKMRIPRVLGKKEEKKSAKEALTKKIDEILSESTALQDFVRDIGVTFKGFTLDDFDFDDSTTARRRERILTKMAVEIAKNVSEARKNELSAIAKTAEELKKAGFPKAKAQIIASDRYQDLVVGEKGRLQKIIWPGALSIPEIAAQWEIGKGLLAAREGMPKEKRESLLTEEDKRRIAEEMKKKTERGKS